MAQWAFVPALTFPIDPPLHTPGLLDAVLLHRPEAAGGGGPAPVALYTVRPSSSASTRRTLRFAAMGTALAVLCELAGKAKAALNGPLERGPTTAPPRSVAEAVKRLEADYEGEPYFLTGKMDAGCCQ